MTDRPVAAKAAMSPRTRIAILLAVLVAVLAVSLALRRRAPNLLLITVDTLRPDRLGCYGYARGSSPHLDALAGEGVVFRNAYSQSGWTLPSMASVLTGLYPHQHGATRFDTGLRLGLPTLATILHGEGYDTRAYVSHSLVSETYGLDRGFANFDSSVLARGHPARVTTSAALTDRVLEDLRDLREPYFVWVHYFDPHALYLVHEGFDFGSSESERYDGEVAHNDRQIGRLLSALDDGGLLKRTAVVFTADHGEEFQEHGGRHHFTLYDEVLRVPLIIRAPALRPGARGSRAQQIDLLPTILRLLGLEVPAAYPGRDLLAQGTAEAPVLAERLQPNRLRQRAVIRGDFKLIRVEPNPDPADYAGRFAYDDLATVGPGTHLFDLRSDPGETRNLIAERPDLAARLLALLEAHVGAAQTPEPSLEVSEELEESLRALGYIQ